MLDAPQTTVDAPAKVNLALHVVGRRADGYHDIETLAVFTRLGDRLTVASSPSDTFRVDGPFAGDVPVDGTNLVLRAREALRDEARQHCPPIALSLDKELPVASGIGGGSSDAAAALRALADQWRLHIGLEELARLGARLGADVPMCLTARPLVARGVGDRIETLRGFPALDIVLVNPGVAVSTPSVFRLLQRTDNAPLGALPRHPDFGDIVGWLGSTRNDLEDAATSLVPPIGDALGAMAREGAAFVRMSGSGATCFGLFESAAHAARAAKAIGSARPDWFVAATESGASQS
ncbi:MAG: 4-(cytidine 5'-diphospho)-2-C-methyl-D-erythritol kinase [Rhizobiaceae bacterium]|nr:4-(cytidine 5'-diphospho)-2-C-methyl-D-erythritol kinase [Rhizobiaceae bacterium]